jgi:excisionase family DNA binding protein
LAQFASRAAPVPLPPSETVSVEVAAARLGLSRSKAYELARHNALPVPVLRFGRKMAIPARALDRVLAGDSADAVARYTQLGLPGLETGDSPSRA